jgi:ribosomal protein S6--L-glutamate ligase
LKGNDFIVPEMACTLYTLDGIRLQQGEKSVQLGILSQDPSIYSTRRLCEAAVARKHTVQVVDFLRCILGIHATQPTLQIQGNPLPRFDAIIPRIGPARANYGIAVVRHCELMGVPVLNSAQAIATATDKLHCYQQLAAAHLPFPTTGFAQSLKDSSTLFSIVGKLPFVLKLLRGSHGVGVVLAEQDCQAQAMLEALRSAEVDVLVQSFVEESRGVDIRCFVIGQRVIAAIERKGPPGEFRANLHRGGSARAIAPTPQETQLAVQAAQAIGLQIAGVDLLRTAAGSLILEVNGSPGLEGIEKTTGVDVAIAIIKFLEHWVETQS